jgi:hypothetical protein
VRIVRSSTTSAPVDEISDVILIMRKADGRL